MSDRYRMAFRQHLRSRADSLAALQAIGWQPVRGRKWAGPCPLCGGHDRFYLTKDGGMYCRQCLQDGGNKERFKALLRTLGLAGEAPDGTRGPEAVRTVSGRSRPSPPSPSDSGDHEHVPDGAGLAGALVRSLSGLSDGARRWLAFRGLDPDRLRAKGWRSLTPGDNTRLKYLLLEYGFRWRESGPPRWPPGTGGPYEALFIPCRGPDGKIAGARFRTSRTWQDWRTENGRKGPKVVGLPSCPAVVYGADSFWPGCRVVHVCEGETDSESLIEAGAAAPVVGLPGATVWRPLVPLLTRHRVSIQRVVIWFDGDEAGQAAAARLAKRLDTAVWTAQLPAGKDVNDWLRDGSEGVASAVTEAETRSRRVMKALRV